MEPAPIPPPDPTAPDVAPGHRLVVISDGEHRALSGAEQLVLQLVEAHGGEVVLTRELIEGSGWSPGAATSLCDLGLLVAEVEWVDGWPRTTFRAGPRSN